MEINTEKVIVTSSFDDIRSSDVRFLEEAAKRGVLHVFLWSDELIVRLNGNSPKFPQEERLYFLKAIRHVSQAHLVNQLADLDSLPGDVEPYSGTWVVEDANDNLKKRDFCASNGIKYHVIERDILNDFSKSKNPNLKDRSVNKKVVVTGCYDWFHSGHVRFFESVSELGDLYVVVGSDENVRFLKGEGHPMFSADERRYMVQSIRFVKQAVISSGSGWMDAEPEIDKIKPDTYVVNEDGDVPEKRAFCESHGIQYVVLKRTPKEGLPRRISTNLRGF
jgi:cytidyltransferase-like protein